MGLIKVVNHRDSRVVLSRETRVKIKDNDELRILETVLNGGANNVDADELKLFRANDRVEQMFACGMLVVEGAVVDATQETLPTHGGDLSRLKLKSALNAVKSCKDPRQLRVWINQDGRPEIREALIARHTELTQGPTDAEGVKAADVDFTSTV